jgi:ubiquitin-activating enzyme E1
MAPLTAFFGGIVGQEVMKACSGKFHPLMQWLYFDAEEALPANGEALLPAEQTAPRGTRYDGQAGVLGWPLVEKLFELRYLLVGSGAIGCEMLKNWAMMGVGTGANGGVVLTDPDTIEKSNLSRQFLFRSWDIQSSKAQKAAAAISVMNPQMKVEALLQRVGAEIGPVGQVTTGGAVTRTDTLHAFVAPSVSVTSSSNTYVPATAACMSTTAPMPPVTISIAGEGPST